MEDHDATDPSWLDGKLDLLAVVALDSGRSVNEVADEQIQQAQKGLLLLGLACCSILVFPGVGYAEKGGQKSCLCGRLVESVE
jgi:hypothetical protein